MDGLCDICGRATTHLNTCTLCGKRVCSSCLILEKGTCRICLGGRRY